MPIFEYACQQCGNAFEALVRSSTVPECPSCHSTKLEKKLSVFAAPASAAPQLPPMSPCGGCQHAGGPGGCAMQQ